jgi:hypothetical protein
MRPFPPHPQGTTGGGTSDCLYFIGVFPVCSGGPGIGCTGPDAFRVTFAGDTGVERVPDDCFSPGRLCTLPVESTSISVTRRYAGYVGDQISSAYVSIAACYGDITAYTCGWAAYPNERCNPVSMPGA